MNGAGIAVEAQGLVLGSWHRSSTPRSHERGWHHDDNNLHASNRNNNPTNDNNNIGFRVAEVPEDLCEGH